MDWGCFRWLNDILLRLHLALHVQDLSLLLCCSVPGTALRYEHPNSVLYIEVWEIPLKILPTPLVSHNKDVF